MNGSECSFAFGELEGLLPDEDVVVLPRIKRVSGGLAYRFVKHLFDIAACSFALAVLAFPMLLIAVKIKSESPGPAIYAQCRAGKGGRVFELYKFRSMCVDAESKLAELRELNEKTGPVFKIAADPRITRVGRVTRKLSIDELPQFANVLKGDIALRILKMRQVFSERLPGVFALPATEVRAKEAVFPHVKCLLSAGLRALRCASSHSTSTFCTASQILAKHVFRVLEGDCVGEFALDVVA